MKLHILSDLHLTVGALEVPANEADAVILAGDVARPKEAVAWALRFAKPVFYVAGNHEFYGGSIPGTMAELKRHIALIFVHGAIRSPVCCRAFSNDCAGDRDVSFSPRAKRSR